MNSRFARGLDWPLSYEDLRPLYDQVQREVGISGDASAEVWRPPGDPYPMPPLPVFSQGRLIERGLKALGLRTAPLPLAIDSIEHQGRAPCLYDGWCDAGCPIGALANPLALYANQAIRAGATISHDRTVTLVLTNAQGDRDRRRVRGHGRAAPGPACRRRHPGGVRDPEPADPAQLGYRETPPRAGERERAGRQVRHGPSPRQRLRPLQRRDAQLLGGDRGQLLSQERSPKDPRKGYLGSSQWVVANALKPNDLLGIANARPDLFGTPLHALLQTASRHLGTMTVFGETLPHPDNRLVLSDRTDRHGLPLARLIHGSGPDDARCFETGMTEGLAILRAAGAYQVWAEGAPTRTSWGDDHGPQPPDLGDQQLRADPRESEPVRGRAGALAHIGRRQSDLHHPRAGPAHGELPHRALVQLDLSRSDARDAAGRVRSHAERRDRPVGTKVPERPF